MPAGVIERGNYQILLRIPGVFTDLDQLRDTVVAVRDGVPIQLREIASVDDTFQRVTRVARINDREGMRLAVYKQSGQNTVNVAERVLKEIGEIQRDIPQIELLPTSNSAEYIRRAIDNVGSSAMWGSVLAILALLVFLVNIRSTLVVAVSIPISLVGTIALIYFGGFTLNTMTLGALALGIGQLIDSSIVVLENIYRMEEGGVPALKASIDGVNEVAAPIAVGAITTCVVFLPMIFMKGMSGVMFKQLAYVVSFANLMGLFVALTMVPMLSSRLIRVVKPVDPNTKKPLERLANVFLNGFRKLENWYKRLLHKALDHRVFVLGSVAALLIGCLFLIRLVGNEFMPATDENEVRVSFEMEVGTRLEVMGKTFATATEIVKQAVPEIVSREDSFGGGGWRSGANTGNMTLKLVPRDKRSRSTEDIAVDLRKKLANIPGTVVRTRASGGQMMFGMRGGGGQERLQIEIRGYDLAVSEALARKVQEVVKTVKGVTDTRVSREVGNPEELLVIDRQAAADMKLSVSEIGQSIQTVLSGTQASYFRESGREFRILVKVKDSEFLNIQDILDLTVSNSEGEQISLRNVIATRPRRGPIRIERRDRERVVTVSGEIAGRDLGSVIDESREAMRSIPIPRNFSIGFTGDYVEQQKANKELLQSIILALILVYMIMAMLYESLRDPFIVMFSVPLAAIGVILTLFLTKTSFNMQSYIGLIMLGGIVVNNAIIIVDYTNLLRQRDKMPIREAIEEAGRRRLRPILMTAFTAVMATFPLALGLGEGGEAQAPLARTVIGGLLSSTLITLIVVPVVYNIFEDFRRKKEHGEAADGAAKTGGRVTGVRKGDMYRRYVSPFSSRLHRIDGSVPIAAIMPNGSIHMIDLTEYGWNAALAAAFGECADEGLVPGRVIRQSRDRSSRRDGRRRGRRRGLGPVPSSGPRPRRLPGRRRLGGRAAGRRRSRRHRGPPAAPERLHEEGGRGGRRGPGRRGQRRHRVPRQRPRRRLQRAADRALPDDGLVERGRAGHRAQQGRPPAGPPGRHRRNRGVAPGVPIVAVRALAEGGLEGLAPYLRAGRTVALLGSSGVGKSTMINRLLGEERFATASMSDAAAGRGRHTTTARELVRLPGGALLDRYARACASSGSGRTTKAWTGPSTRSTASRPDAGSPIAATSMSRGAP